MVLNAFEKVLSKRQSKYVKVLEWLDGQIDVMRRKEAKVCSRLSGVLNMKEFEDDE